MIGLVHVDVVIAWDLHKLEPLGKEGTGGEVWPREVAPRATFPVVASLWFRNVLHSELPGPQSIHSTPG